MTKKNRIHILTWAGIGDAILLSPSLRQIKQSFPQSRLIVHAIHKKHYEVLLHNPHIDLLRLESRPVAFCYELLRKNGYLPTRYRLSTYGEYAPSMWFPEKKGAEIIAELIGVELSNSTPELFLTAKEDALAKAALRGLPCPVAIQTRSSRITKDWPKESWLNLMSRNTQYDWVELGVLGQSRLTGTVELPAEQELRQEFALLKYCKAFVGVDSCFAHAASAFGVPGVVLFGMSSPGTWGHPSNVNISAGLRCSPCIDIIGSNKCPYGVACMNMIAVDEVEQALRRQLSSNMLQ
jgi:ADP-heptose:LPS heptosyltransferase